MHAQKGFILALTILLVLGVSAISVGTMYTSKMGRMSASNYSKKTQSFLASDGLMTLLAQEIINGKGKKYIDASRTGEIDGQVWINIAGSDVDPFIELPSSRSHPGPERHLEPPRVQRGLRQLRREVDRLDHPPLSGNYTFYARSDDDSKFFLSSDASKGNLDPNPKCWLDTLGVQLADHAARAVSKPIPLIGGNRYYFEYYHKEGTGVDVGQVGWDGPEYFSERPISGKHLSRYSSDPAWAGTVTVGGIPVRYQVQSAGLDRYRITTESIITKPKAPNDTAFRTPLAQTLSLKGAPVMPPDKMWLRVIHYDFPSNGAANEFNQPVNLGVYKGMVQNTLTNFVSTDADFFGKATIPKPTRGAITPNRNCGLDELVQDWAHRQPISPAMPPVRGVAPPVQ